MSNSLVVSRKIKPVVTVNVGAAPPPWYAHRPIRTILYYVLVAEALLLQVPIRYALYTLLPRFTKPHRAWTTKQAIVTALIRHFSYYRRSLHVPLGNVDKTVFPRLSAEKDGATAVWVAPLNAQIDLEGEMKDLFVAGGCSTRRVLAYWYEANSQAASREAKGHVATSEDEQVVLFFHGGGYRDLNALPSCPLTDILRTILHASLESGTPNAPCRALSVEYRLTNETTFPGIFADALASWLYLVRNLHFRPENILIAGDSAGGNLALALLRYLRDHRPLWTELGLPLDSPIANGLILSSPWLDISGSYVNAGPSSSGARFCKIDNLEISNLTSDPARLVQGLPIWAVRSKYLSCVTIDSDVPADLFDGFPRALCFYGELEVLSDEVKAFAHYYRYAADGGRAGPLLLHGEPNGVHDYLAFTKVFGAEQKRAQKIMSKWI